MAAGWRPEDGADTGPAVRPSLAGLSIASIGLLIVSNVAKGVGVYSDIVEGSLARVKIGASTPLGWNRGRASSSDGMQL